MHGQKNIKKSDKVLLNEPRRKYTPTVFRSRIVVFMGGSLAEEGVSSWTNKGRHNLAGNLGKSRGFTMMVYLLTAVGLSPGGSTHLHKQNIE
jgi:hypothetical protein